MFDFGWSKGKLTNKATGVQIRLNRTWFNFRHQKRVYTPPKSILGRAGAVRVKKGGKFDWLFVSLYYPPKPRNAQEVPKYKKTVDAINKWLLELLQSLPSRTTVAIGADVNNDFGLPQDGTPNPDPELIGSIKPGMQQYAATTLAETLAPFHLTPVNTMVGDGFCTWYGEEGRCSRIDFLFLPRGLIPDVEWCVPLYWEAKRLQMHTPKSGALYDHVPFETAVEFLLEHTPPPTKEPKFDKNKLVEAVKTGKGQAEFLNKLNEKCSDTEALVVGLEMGDNQNTSWETFVEDVRAIGIECFGEDEQNTGEEAQINKIYKGARAHQQRLLKTRAKMKVDYSNGRIPTCLYEHTVQKLKQVTKMVKAIGKAARSFKVKHVAEILVKEAEKGHAHEVAKLGRQLAGTGVGPGTIHYRAPKMSQICSHEFGQLLETKGSEGGMSETTVQFPKQPPAPPDRFRDFERLDQAARIELKEVGKIATTLPMRKSTPLWSIPSEILRLIFGAPKRFIAKAPPEDQNASSKKLQETVEKCSSIAQKIMATMGWTPGKGLGKHEQGHSVDPNETKDSSPKPPHARQKVQFDKIYKRLRGIIAQIRWMGATPSDFNRSWGLPIPKGNKKEGARGARLIHRMCAFAKAFYRNLLFKSRRKNYVPHHPGAHGAIPAKRKESAILIQLCTSWRLIKIRVKHATMFFDQTNASRPSATTRLTALTSLTTITKTTTSSRTPIGMPLFRLTAMTKPFSSKTGKESSREPLMLQTNMYVLFNKKYSSHGWRKWAKHRHKKTTWMLLTLSQGSG